MSWWNKDQEEEEQEEENEDSDYKAADDKIIFLIDCRHDMFGKNSKGEVHLVNCLRVLVEVMKTKVVASDKSSVGVVFYGTLNKDADGTMEGVHMLFPPDTPSAPRIRQLQSYIDDLNKFQADIGSQTAHQSYCPLREALWICSQAFHVRSNSQRVNDFRRIWIFTNDDRPNAHSLAEQEKIIKVAKDGAETGIEISLWHLNRKGAAPFDPSAFYVKLLELSGTAEDEPDDLEMKMMSSGDDGFDAMLMSVRKKQHKKRRLGIVYMSLGPGMAQPLCVEMYKLISVTKKPYHKWLHAKSNEPLQIRSKFIDGETGESLDDSNIETYLDIAGFRLPFTAEEMAIIKQGAPNGGADTSGGNSTAFIDSSSGSSWLGKTISGGGVDGNASGDSEEVDTEPRLHLLFFTAASNLPAHLNIDSPIFLRPSEATVKGSTALFTSLLVDLSKKGLIAMARFRRTKGGVPRLAALIPQMEEPAGLHLVTLPFLEEVRGPPNPTVPPEELAAKVSPEAVHAAEQLVSALQFAGDFDYTTHISTPGLQKFYSVLQAVALQEDVDWTAESDTMVPDAETLERHSEAILAFKSAAGISDADLEAEESQSKKRPAPSAKAEAAKKAKAALDPGDVAMWKDMIAVGEMSKQKNDILKEICAALALAVGGTKAVLLERIQEALSKL